MNKWIVGPDGMGEFGIYDEPQPTNSLYSSNKPPRSKYGSLVCLFSGLTETQANAIVENRNRDVDELRAICKVQRGALDFYERDHKNCQKGIDKYQQI